MKRKLMHLSAIAAGAMVLLFMPLPAQASEAASPESSPTYQSIVPTAQIIDWRWKIEDGKMYKRLYNYTIQQWVGEWIYCP